MQKQAGRLIVIEGLDGSGKATQAAQLTQWLESRGEPVRQVSFPDYDSDSSVLVRMYLEGRIGQVGEVNAYAASSFYAADRYISYCNSWGKAYQSGHTIVSDRYTTSNAAHQMSKLPVSEWDAYLAWLADYEYEKMGLPAPDQVLYLDVPPEVSRQLMEKRSADTGVPMDLHERDTTYLLQCRQAALYAAERWGWQVVHCAKEGGLRMVADIFDEITQAITERI